MTQVSVPQQDGEIVVYDGESTSYPVKNGVIVVSAGHLAAVLSGVPGSELKKPEPPAKETT